MPLTEFPLPDLVATERLAKLIAPHLKRSDLLALAGPLGSGKTTFARALLRELGVTDNVPSPTFTLLQIYDAEKFPVAHFDLYRLKSAAELDELGWDDALADNLVLAEWPERAQNRLPANRLTLHFALDGKNMRRCSLEGHGNWVKRMQGIKL